MKAKDHFVQASAAEEDNSAADNVDMARSDFTQAQIDELRKDLAIIMDDYLEKQADAMQKALDNNDLTDFLQIWTKCFETSILHCTGLKECDQVPIPRQKQLQGEDQRHPEIWDI